MEANVLRSPIYSGSVALKTGTDALQKSVIDSNISIHEAKTETEIVTKDISTEDCQSALMDLEERRRELHLLKSELENKRIELDKDRNNYKDFISKEVENKYKEKYLSDISEFKSNIHKLMDALVSAKTNEISSIEDDIVSIVYESICKIIGNHIQDNNFIISIVKEVIALTHDRMQMRVRVCPAHYEILLESKELLACGFANKLEIVSDEHIVYGGCIVETDAGSIDGRLDTQLKNLLSLLLSSRANNS